VPRHQDALITGEAKDGHDSSVVAFAFLDCCLSPVRFTDHGAFTMNQNQHHNTYQAQPAASQRPPTGISVVRQVTGALPTEFGRRVKVDCGR